jgi:hypothetical protein
MDLKPYKQTVCREERKLSDYFQTFALPRYTVDVASVSINPVEKDLKQILLIPGKSFALENTISDLSLESALVFAGYGINSPAQKYNDYANLKVKGKLVVILDGYPGQHDTLSSAWEKFRTFAETDSYNLSMKCREAARQGAAAVMVVNKNYLQSNFDSLYLANTDNPEESSSPEVFHYLPGAFRMPVATCFLLTETGSAQVAAALQVNFRGIEKTLAQQLSFAPIVSKNIFKIALETTLDTLSVHNVLGVLPGLDTTQTLILGAHYDHLGKHDHLIYYGSDDNASGVAGLLALAENWTDSHLVPPCNILFASWTAEEKGLIGSEYFAENLSSPEKVKLYINMDMISRSVVEDTTRRQLSIGTRTSDKYIRDLAQKTNATIDPPFILDLWDVTGHSGSDYASFTAKNIPIMTYNTGLHNDYHTPRDIPANADLVKMGDVLKVVNGSLQEILQNVIGK